MQGYDFSKPPPVRAAERRRRARDVASDLNRGIRSGRYRPGERLPTVLDLAEHYGVASNTAREALAQLESLGLIDIRHGAGTFVTEHAGRLLFTNPYDEHLGIRRTLDLLATRVVLEPPLAAAAAQRVTAPELDALGALLSEAELFLGGSGPANDRLNELNLRFHCAIARASRNQVAADVVEVLARLYHREHLALLPLCAAYVEDHPRVDHRAHAGILEALASGDGEHAQRCMLEHIEGVRAVVCACISSSDDWKGGDGRDTT